MRIWNPSTGASLGSIFHNRPVNWLVLSRTGALIATVTDDNTVRTFSGTTYAQLGSFFPPLIGTTAVGFAPNDHRLVIGGTFSNAAPDEHGDILIYNADARTLHERLRGHNAAASEVRFLANGAQLLSAGSEGLMHLWNVTPLPSGADDWQLFQ